MTEAVRTVSVMARAAVMSAVSFRTVMSAMAFGAVSVSAAVFFVFCCACFKMICKLFSKSTELSLFFFREAGGKFIFCLFAGFGKLFCGFVTFLCEESTSYAPVGL